MPSDSPQARILIIEDQKENLDLLIDMIGAASYQVFGAQTGEAGLKLAFQHIPDLVLLDIQMPGLSGFDICKRLKANAATHDVPVIFVTAADRLADKIEGFRLGAVDYITKPYQLEEVRIRVRTHLNIYHHQRELTRQREEIETLRDTAAIVNSTLQLGDVMDRILSNLRRVVPHDRANIMLIDDEGMAQVVGCLGYAAATTDQLLQLQFSVADLETFRWMVESRQPLIVADRRQEPVWQELITEVNPLGYLGIPIIGEDEVIGFINLDSDTPGFFTIEYADKLRAFTDQVAIAIRNARLYEQAQALAAAQERQRLARDLHDAVSQTLFSASVMAETLPMLLDHDPEATRQGLNQLARLTKGALSEMRTLLVELRPMALVETDLSVLVMHLVNAVRTRIDAEISLMTEGPEFNLPTEVKIQLYRIGQEALNNVSKYALASRVTVEVLFTDDGVALIVEDNGAGFVPDQIGADHMGIRIMYERAAAAAIGLSITTAPGEGTRVIAQWSGRSQS